MLEIGGGSQQQHPPGGEEVGQSWKSIAEIFWIM
jgi:hypothetical protein